MIRMSRTSIEKAHRTLEAGIVRTAEIVGEIVAVAEDVREAEDVDAVAVDVTAAVVEVDGMAVAMADTGAVADGTKFRF